MTSHKLILLDIFSYSCMNCLRSFNFINKMDDKYGRFGLETIILHPPEWEFEKNSNNILKALEKYKIKFPVIIDKNKRIINKLKISFWPAQILIKDGTILYKHIGEGDYKRLEDSIRKILNINVKKIFNKEPKYARFPTIYLGKGREGIIKSIGNQLKFGIIYTEGRWSRENECLISIGNDCSITLLTKGNIINFVAKSINKKPLENKIILNNKAVKRIIIKEPRLYQILKLKNNGQNKLALKAKTGLAIYSFSFQ